MWQDTGDQPVIDLTTASGEAERDVEEASPRARKTRCLSRSMQQRMGYRSHSGLVSSLVKAAAVKGKNPSPPEATEMQAESTAPSTSDGPSTSESDTQYTASLPQKGHFTLCPNGRALKCNYCAFMCRRTCGRMIKHLQVHGIRSRNQCKSCGLGFLNKFELQDHQKVCTQASLAPQCSECGKTFSFRSLLRQHMNTHMNKKPFKCRECPISFNSSVLCKLHMDKHHSNANRTDQGGTHQCSQCSKHFDTKVDLDSHLRQHIQEKLCKRTISSTTTRCRPVDNARRVTSSAKKKDDAWLQPCLIRTSVTSSTGRTSNPVSSPTMTMPIVVSVSSQQPRERQTEVVDMSSLAHPKPVDRPSELTAGSPERIDAGLDPTTCGLVYMRRELNPDASNDNRRASGISVLRSWSVSDSSDPMASSDIAVAQVEEEPSQRVKREFNNKDPHNEIEHTSIISTGRSSVESGTMNHGVEVLSPLASRQHLEPTSTGRENEGLVPIEIYPIQYQQYLTQNASESGDKHQRLLEVERAGGNRSPDGSYGRRSADDAINPESPCGATSTRRSLDSQDTLSGSLRCVFCDITFGDPIMHYLHMGWHVTGDPWKCNGCGHECVGKVDFFLHLYKAGHN